MVYLKSQTNLGVKERARAQGVNAEERVAAHLQADGFSIVARNYQVFGGELDIVAVKGEQLIFVEVKYRKSPQMAIEYLVPLRKQQRLIYAARCFMSKVAATHSYFCRFDVAIVVERGARSELVYLPNAFQAGE